MEPAPRKTIEQRRSKLMPYTDSIVGSLAGADFKQ